MIKPEFWEDVKVAKLNMIERLLFIALWNFADDEGFLPYDLQWIKAKAFPYDKNVKVKTAIDNLVKNEFLFLQNEILLVKNFKKHQTLNRPSKSKLKAIFEKHSQNNGEITESSVNTHESLTPEMNGNRKEMKGNERARESENEMNGKSGDAPEPPVSSGTNQNGVTATTPNDTTEKPMPWNEQSKYAQSLGISLATAEQIIQMAKDNHIMLYRVHWRYFAENQNMSTLLPVFKSLIESQKRKLSSKMRHIGGSG